MDEARRNGPEGRDDEDGQVSLWREALAAGSSASPDVCPSAERIWDLARSGATSPEIERLTEHASQCGACTEAWRVAVAAAKAEREGRTEDRGTTRALPFPRRGRRLAAILAPVAAALVLVFGLVFRSPSGPVSDDTVRAPDAVKVESRIDGERLPRGASVLRWSAPRDDLNYQVWVTLEDTTPIVQAQDLDRSEFEIPTDHLQSIPAGTTILWRVETTLDDGTILRSSTFANILE